MYHVGDRFDRLVVIGLSRKTPKSILYGVSVIAEI